MADREITRRRWQGESPDERTAARRERLLEAGLELLGTEGAAAVTMRGTCRAARLTERYFYESFDSRDDLLVAVLDHVVEGAKMAVLAALATPGEESIRVRHVVTAFTDHIAADRRRGRVMFVAPQEDPALARRGDELVEDFITLMVVALESSSEVPHSKLDVRLNATAIFGAMAYLYQGWLRRRPRVSKERLVEHVSLMIEAQIRVDSAHD
ncbi:TetR/AcrR family transcriptional regulator [Janibacter sp. G1551]|uniref:TetR/AcrR family transcriptional regulator n=1 Tax=Janibacter sp. G1551 TaxID=3420440 RepID=UPI003D036F5F